ncbi:MAG: hypothetical protein GY699_06015 [Desulfobacteraceae bacterium]|nr:hypothetical protein [Desulfobacteraceae bacterium]
MFEDPWHPVEYPEEWKTSECEDLDYCNYWSFYIGLQADAVSIAAITAGLISGGGTLPVAAGASVVSAANGVITLLVCGDSNFWSTLPSLWSPFLSGIPGIINSTADAGISIYQAYK